MGYRTSTLVAAFAGFLTASAALAQTNGAAATPDPILTGYNLLYSGDKLAAMRYFDDMAAAKPADLTVGFARLFMHDQRLGVDPALVAPFEKDLDAFIDAADKRRSRTSQDTEALFYEAQAYLLRGKYKFEHNKGALAAVRDGAKAKGYIESYLKVHPEHGDAYLAAGFYNYYIDLAPAFFSFFKLFLFLPGGDRVKGLQQIEKTAREGSLFAPFAQSILIDIYSSLEGRPADAIAMAERFTARFPDNDEVSFTLAGFYGGPVMDEHPKAARVYETVLERHRTDTTPDGINARINAMFGLLSSFADDWRYDEAIARATSFIDEHPTKPDWLLPNLLLRRANYRGVINDPSYAADLQRILDDTSLSNWHKQATDMKTSLDARRASGEAATSAAMIPANRLAADHRWADARRAYEALQQKDPKSPAIRWRLAFVDFASGLTDRALPALKALADGDKTIPDNVKAQCWLYIGRAYDILSRRDDAKHAYKKVIDDFSKQIRPVSYAKAGLVTPYKRPESWTASTSEPAGR